MDNFSADVKPRIASMKVTETLTFWESIFFFTLICNSKEQILSDENDLDSTKVSLSSAELLLNTARLRTNFYTWQDKSHHGSSASSASSKIQEECKDRYLWFWCLLLQQQWLPLHVTRATMPELLCSLTSLTQKKKYFFFLHCREILSSISTYQLSSIFSVICQLLQVQ